MPSAPTRRGALGLLAAAAALPLAAPARAQLGAPSQFGAPIAPPLVPAPAPAGLHFDRVVVDARALLTPVNARLAELVTADMTADLHRVFAAELAGRGGPTLLVRVHSLYLVAWAGGRSGSTGDGPDNIEGTGIVTAGGRVLSETPVYTTLDPSYSGAWYLPDIDRLRVSSICYQFAYWLHREMGF